MNSRAIRAVAAKDIRAITANIQVWLPMAVVPLILGVLLPAGIMLALRSAGPDAPTDEVRQLLAWLERVPPGPLRSTLDALPGVPHRLAYLAANYMFAPFFLLIPLMASSVVAADSFAGEKERGTLEGLLLSPADLPSLFLGKVLAAFLPAMALSLVTLILYGTVVNSLGWPLFGRIFFPHLNWLPMMLLVIPMASLLAILLNVLISARVSSFQAAFQLGGLVVLPAVALLFGQLSGALLLDTGFLTAVGLVLAVVNGALFGQVRRWLNRNQLFESQIQ